MDKQGFWNLIDEARTGMPEADAADGHAVAERAAELLAARPVEEIVATEQPLWDLMTDSYRTLLWAAAYVINGGASDDGFDYFRGWLITQGRGTFERAVADPDSLADLPAVRDAAERGVDFDCEETLCIAWNAHLKVTGEELPPGSFTVRYTLDEPHWDFEDTAEMRRRLPRITALHGQ